MNGNDETKSIPTQRQLLHHMRTEGGLTARELASRLGITAVAVRRHLANLEQTGLARASVVRRKVGRPTYVYALTEQAFDLFPTNYPILATQLLDAARDLQGEGFVSSLFAIRMEQLLRQLRPRMLNKSLGERVAELARIQDEAGYMATFERTESGYLLKENNCAIYRVACRFQHACQFEIELFRLLLDADITRVQHQLKGELCCAYLIRERDTPSKAGDAPVDHPHRRQNTSPLKSQETTG